MSMLEAFALLILGGGEEVISLSIVILSIYTLCMCRSRYSGPPIPEVLSRWC